MPLDSLLLGFVAALAAALVLAARLVVLQRELPDVRRGQSELGAAPGRTPPAAPDARLAAADEVGIGLLLIDGDDRIAAANRAAGELLRVPDRLVGRSTMEAFIDHSVAELVRTAQLQGRAKGEYTIPGEPLLTVALHAWRDGDRRDAWVALEDVSELRRLRRIRTEFIDNLAHELRTPLTTVRLLSESLAIEAERTELPSRVRDSIGKIDVETGHLVQMVNELLDLSKIEQGEAPLDLARLDLGRVVEDSIERLRSYAERQGVTLRHDMPAPDVERQVVGDEERLGQLLVNLIHNAIKFSPDGGDVIVRIRPAPHDVVVEVADSGVGIPPRDLERIFERFYKVDRARVRGRGGTGLGLSIARHIAERHGGRLWAESTDARGSSFFLSLSRAPGDGRPGL